MSIPGCIQLVNVWGNDESDIKESQQHRLHKNEIYKYSSIGCKKMKHINNGSVAAQKRNI
ncbi:hypothetical protein [Paenibacillus terrae]|uniref:Uncharacterized protein n=1 Tax=Paenibacillus terrae TaxID=159743 RepID=A0A0D7WZR3_9BACL|nr:hypothetical protein [Paenibacillus terrae]KJD44691.1 hypothetical protein QD47_15740 [Paenibacillus terrae]